MLKIYGSMLCKDCIQCRQDLDAAGVAYSYHDFADELLNLKEFLQIRDREPIFGVAKEDGLIGIPCIVCEDGSVTLQWKQFLM